MTCAFGVSSKISLTNQRLQIFLQHFQYLCVYLILHTSVGSFVSLKKMFISSFVSLCVAICGWKQNILCSTVVSETNNFMPGNR